MSTTTQTPLDAATRARLSALLSDFVEGQLSASAQAEVAAALLHDDELKNEERELRSVLSALHQQRAPTIRPELVAQLQNMSPPARVFTLGQRLHKGAAVVVGVAAAAAAVVLWIQTGTPVAGANNTLGAGLFHDAVQPVAVRVSGVSADAIVATLVERGLVVERRPGRLECEADATTLSRALLQLQLVAAKNAGTVTGTMPSAGQVRLIIATP